MNSNDVYQKSNLGREEIRNQTLGVLPREARTLLITIDGKKTYQNYLDSLNDNDMFAEFGGITPLFELLVDFQCIELSPQSKANAAQLPSNVVNQPQSTTFTQPDGLSTTRSEVNTALNNRQTSVDHYQASRSSVIAFDAVATQVHDEAELAAEFNNVANHKLAAKEGFVNSKAPKVSYETIKSDLATYIEKNLPAQEAWGYLLSLERCENDSQLLALVQRIQQAINGNNMAWDMDNYMQALRK